MTELIEITVQEPALGSHQLRDALGLSLISQKPFRLKGIKGIQKDKPGLRREDVIGIDLATSIGKARIDGVRTGSQEICFVPTGLFPGNYTFSVGSAGNAVHLVQIVALPLCFGMGPSEVTVFGITHDPSCPSFEFFDSAYIRLLRAGGLQADPVLHYAGYSPRGVGKVSLTVRGGQLLRRFHLLERGEITKKRAHIIVGEQDAEVRDKMKARCAEMLDLAPGTIEINPRPNGPDTANSINVFVESEYVTEIFSGCSQDGEDFFACAGKVAQDLYSYVNSKAAAGPSLTEHLIMVMAAAGGGSFTTTRLTNRAEATLALIPEFLHVDVKKTDLPNGNIEVEIKER
jgi:RNA 3'-terminal phosphate cyclase (ATP)